MTLKGLYQLFLQHPAISTDSRKVVPGGLFFALKGPSFNGNAFAGDALKKGAAYAIVDEEEYLENDRFILVKDVLSTLQDLGTHHRLQCSARIISLTGSNGKTTTKELIYSVLSRKYSTIATRGNLNNHIGVPLTLLSIKKDTEIAIIEMGANHQKEIEFLSTLALPDHGYITNFGKAHLEGFGGVAGVIKGKSELYQNLNERSGHIFWNADDPIQEEKLRDYPNKTGFSTRDKGVQRIEFLGADPLVKLSVNGTRIETQLPGDYNFPNTAIAALMGLYFKVPLAEIKAGLEAYLPDNNRSQLLHKNGIKVLLDAYNANPTSMQAALEAFGKLPEKDKIVILGDMFELGESAAEEHQTIASMAEKIGFKYCHFIGEKFYATVTKCKKFESFDDFSVYIKQHPIKNGTILIKGSRGMRLERVLDLI
jgi:UDP-N-acetylmuramoyl-tripeptide--D-alanyl-D-alanine ligase